MSSGGFGRARSRGRGWKVDHSWNSREDADAEPRSYPSRSWGRGDGRQFGSGWGDTSRDSSSKWNGDSRRSGGGGFGSRNHGGERREKRRDNGPSHRSNGFGRSDRKWGNYSTDEQESSPDPSPAPRRLINWAAIHAGRAQAEAEKWKGLPDIVKNFYDEDPSIASMSEEEVFQFRLENHGILVSDLTDKNRHVPNPVKSFANAFHNYPEILDELEKLGFEKPTPIQSQAWPVVLQGHDMVGIAQTGTGKTLAFLLPGLVHIAGQTTPMSERIGPSALILSPTRELALQIEKEVRKFSYKGIKSVCIYGGGSRREQINVVTQGIEIVIATPGRLSDLQENQILNLKGVTYLVLDEADRMLDMGFEPQIRKILLDIRPTRQTIMTSATWPPGVRRLINDYMKEGPFQVTVGTLDLRACALVEQRVEFIEDEGKKERTMEFIRQMKKGEKVLIFCSRKSTADDLASDLVLNGFPVQSIHGDREQCDREQALDDFTTGLAPILVATDVASRGLDIKDITYVVNYDFPVHIEDYVHRVGRTGRAGTRGKSLTFMSRSNWRWARELCKILADADQEVPHELVSMAERYEKARESRDRFKRY